MAKRASTKKPKTDPTSVPCLRVVIGGKPGKTGNADANACASVGENRGAVTKFVLNRKIGTTSKTVATPEKNKPCLGSLKRKGCPVQLAFDQGQPFLRFCTTEKKPGLRIDVDSPADAVAKADAACATWKVTGKFDLPAGTPVAGRRRRKR